MKITEMIQALELIKGRYGDLVVLNGNGFAIEEVHGTSVEDHFGILASDWGFESGDKVAIIQSFDE